MKLSEDLKQCDASGDFGRALEGYYVRAERLEKLLLLCCKDLYNGHTGRLKKQTALELTKYVREFNLDSEL